VFFQAGGTDLKLPGMEMAAESFSHLAATGIAGTEKEYVRARFHNLQ